MGQAIDWLSKSFGIRRSAAVALTFALLGGVAACAPTETIDSEAGRDSLKTRALAALNQGDCDEASSVIDDLVLSEYVDNEARQLYASALACDAGMSNLVTTTLLISENADGLTTGLWKTLTEVFYDSDLEELERKYTSGFSAQDRLMTIIKPGTTIGISNQFTVDEWNPGSLLISDREEESRLVQLFLSMQTLGQVQAVKADPDPTTFERQRRLGATSATGAGWNDPANIDETACGWAGAAVTMVEGIDEVASMTPDSVAPTLQFIADTYGDLLDDACDAACQGIDLTLSGGADYTGNGCSFAADECRGTDSQHPCLMALRDRAFCATADATTTLDDKVRCAASGIAGFVNGALIGGWTGTP